MWCRHVRRGGTSNADKSADHEQNRSHPMHVAVHNQPCAQYLLVQVCHLRALVLRNFFALAKSVRIMRVSELQKRASQLNPLWSPKGIGREVAGREQHKAGGHEERSG